MTVPILMYHSIIDNHNQSVSIKSFEKQMLLMKKLGYQTINFDKLDDKDNKKKFIITFDDAYENIFLNAFPILKKFGFSATCYVITNKIGSSNDWDKGNENFKEMNLMNFDQIKEWVLNDFEIGSHTMDHLDLTKLNNEEKIHQVANSKKFLSNMFNTKVDSFAYPFGSYDLETQNLVKKYYNFAVTTRRSRYINNKFNYELLPRVPINRDSSLLKFFFKIKTIYEDIKFKN